MINKWTRVLKNNKKQTNDKHNTLREEIRQIVKERQIKFIVNVFADILDTEKLNKTFQDFQLEIVFHLAAQPLVRLSYVEPVPAYQTNVVAV